MTCKVCNKKLAIPSKKPSSAWKSTLHICKWGECLFFLLWTVRYFAFQAFRVWYYSHPNWIFISSSLFGSFNVNRLVSLHRLADLPLPHWGPLDPSCHCPSSCVKSVSEVVLLFGHCSFSHRTRFPFWGLNFKKSMLESTYRLQVDQTRTFLRQKNLQFNLFQTHVLVF